MNLCKFAVVFVAVLLVASTGIEAKKKHKSQIDYPSSKSKIKTKWSSSAEIGPNGSNSMVATEEHGYYVKRTYQPLNASAAPTLSRQSPPYLAIPIAWFSCESDACLKSNSVAINGQMNAIKEGFLCADDCMEPYEPICGKTPSEVAVFYNKCKLNVAKCRTHGLWQDLPYEECKQSYAKELEYTDKKFKSSPFFVDSKDVATTITEVTKDRQNSEDDSILEAALEALTEIGDKLVETEADDADSDSDSDSDSSSSESASESEPGSATKPEISTGIKSDTKTESKPEKVNKNAAPVKTEKIMENTIPAKTEKMAENTMPIKTEKMAENTMPVKTEKITENIIPVKTGQITENATHEKTEKIPEKTTQGAVPPVKVA